MAKHRATNLLREPTNPLPSRAEIDWFQQRLRAWAEENGRDFPWRHTGDEYRIVVTEILLQQTTAAAVAKLYDIFYDSFPTWQALHHAPEEHLRGTISLLGLGTQRTKRLRQLATWVSDHGWCLPNTREELEAVPGVGQYVASALLAVKYGQPEPMLDVNMARVFERYFGVRELADIRDDPWLQMTARLVAPGSQLGWAVLDFAAETCVARVPRCVVCPMQGGCQSARSISGSR